MDRKKKMMPIGPLMIEHRLIERMIRQIDRAVQRMKQTGQADIVFVDHAVDFIRTYADRCHHGKEENILFRELAKKNIPPDHRRIMDELVAEHVWGRSKVAEIVAAKDRYVQGDKTASAALADAITALTAFYPKHIEKEDKGFFLPVMEHFSQAEKDQMLQEGYDFDAGLIHEKYKMLVEDFERAARVEESRKPR